MIIKDKIEEVKRIIGGQVFVKFPFSKKKLQVVDKFTASKDILCPGCEQTCRSTVTVVKSDMNSIKEFYILECNGCHRSTWHARPCRK